MTVGITGASGFIGGALVAEVLSRNGDAIGYSRDASKRINGCKEVRDFDSENLDLSGLNALVHLAGDSLLSLWTNEKKRQILNSRVGSTQRIINALWDMEPEDRPSVFACASAVGIYGDRGNEWLDEESDAGFGFLAKVTKEWEEIALKAQDMGIRTVFAANWICSRKRRRSRPCFAKDL